MTTPRHNRINRPAAAALLATSFATLGGCAYSGGELLFMLGFGSEAKIDAEFRLTDGPVMIFVDDVGEYIDYPPASRFLFDDLAQELLKNEAAKKIVPPETIDQLRQTVPDFDKRGCREVGKLAGAEQVVWIQMEDFLADEKIFDANRAAYATATVKVINVLEEKRRTRVRVWPESPSGERVDVVMAGSEVQIAGSQREVAKEIMNRLAVKTAKFFYDHKAETFDGPDF